MNTMRDTMHLYQVTRRDPLRRGAQKVVVFSYVLMARDEASALSLVQAENLHVEEGASWCATQLDADTVIGLGCFHDDATGVERQARKSKGTP